MCRTNPRANSNPASRGLGRARYCAAGRLHGMREFHRLPSHDCLFVARQELQVICAPIYYSRRLCLYPAARCRWLYGTKNQAHDRADPLCLCDHSFSGSRNRIVRPRNYGFGRPQCDPGAMADADRTDSASWFASHPCGARLARALSTAPSQGACARNLAIGARAPHSLASHPPFCGRSRRRHSL